MKGLKPIVVALSVALSLATAGAAAGEPHGRGGWERAAPPGWAGPGEGHGRWAATPPPAYGYRSGYASAPPPYVAPHAPAARGYALRRGGQAPPQAWDNVIPDYGRHRLRPPPPGYSWVRMGDRYMLVSRSTGQIFDVIGR